MAGSDSALAHFEAQVSQAQGTVLVAQRQWRRLRPDDLDGSWAALVQRLTLVVASGKIGAARAGAAYVPEVLGDAAPVGIINPAAFATTASDGRALDSLLYSALVRVKIGIGAGETVPVALDAGSSKLTTLVRTEVADAGRGATGAAIAATPKAGYVRVVGPSCCQRCAVLAGKFFRWNTGFLRHPRCSCRHQPALEGTDARRISPPVTADQVRDLTSAQRRAVDDGADLNQIINAHRRGARGSDGMTTSEGTTRRGYASYVRRAVTQQRRQLTEETVSRARRGTRNVTRTGARLTPEAIYRVSATREEAVRLLGLNGYIVGDINTLARRLA